MNNQNKIDIDNNDYRIPEEFYIQNRKFSASKKEKLKYAMKKLVRAPISEKLFIVLLLIGFLVLCFWGSNENIIIRNCGWFIIFADHYLVIGFENKINKFWKNRKRIKKGR